ncbi:39763_t:CDS:2, partial [Gigaspora margarita]
VFLEGALRAVKLKGSLSKFKDLDDFYSCLKQNFEELKNVGLHKLLFFAKEDQSLLPDVILISLITTASKPLIVWYLMSDATNVFQDLLKQNYKSLDTVPKFNPNELPAICHLISNQRLDLVYKNLQVEFDGSQSYGYADYAVYIDDNILLVDEAMWEDLVEGIAQCIVEMHTIAETLGKHKCDKLSTIFGIVTTGYCWRFICWSDSLEIPMVEVS